MQTSAVTDNLVIDFSGRQFGKHIILMAVRWYFAYALSYRDIEELLRERGIVVDHATINRWVIEFGPQLAASFKKCKAAATRFFKKAIRRSGDMPAKVTIDKSGSNTAALNAINKPLKKKEQIEVRQIKYLNNIVEQDHRFIKKITKPMKGFKSFNSARATLAGIELHHMLRKRQYVGEETCITVWDQFYELAA